MSTTGQIIHALEAGVVDSTGVVVASGKARFYNPGTLVAANVYSDDACTSAHSQPITLDAGGRKLYVFSKLALRMIVKDATDTTTLFDEICNVVRAEQVYVTNANINGGAEINLDTLLGNGGALIYTEGGASTTRTVQVVLGERMVSVKDYGAVGNGVADDTTAIQNAANRIGTLGGGTLFFPLGTYKITAAITIAANTVVLGAAKPGAGSTSCSIIKSFTNLIAGWFTVANAASNVSIEKISFVSNTTTHGGQIILCGGPGRVVVRDCAFGAFDGTALYANAATSIIVVESCIFSSATETGKFLTSASNGWSAHFTDCQFVGTGGLSQFAVNGAASLLFLTNCNVYSDTGLAATQLFDTSGMVTVTGGSIKFDAAGTTALADAFTILSLVGVRIAEGAGAGTVQLTAAGELYESGCQMSGTVTVAGTGWTGYSGYRDARTFSLSAVTTSHVADAGNYGTVTYTQTGGAAFAWSNPTNDAPLGSILNLIYINSSGGNITNTFGTAFGVGAVTITNNGQVSAWQFVRRTQGANVKWVCVGPQTVFTP